MVCPEFNCDEVVSLIQKLCENIGAMDLQHDRAAVTWIGIFLQMRVKELEDKVAKPSRPLGLVLGLTNVYKYGLWKYDSFHPDQGC